ncbi:predicted protein [Bathycoccus prasinos]|uniref:Ribosome-binding factor A n=1 Tax=Bathycoccus prasinos TaxID=41875 RepID=K8EB51_9CHLO|nr:predicted protein [Bathycoccus prasinos]CCO15147.1 predicted protein [Bathycoccus prasinos]|eukprot:XP_007514907.1 predicted protein [Bathycoccus prasinos]
MTQRLLLFKRSLCLMRSSSASQKGASVSSSFTTSSFAPPRCRFFTTTTSCRLHSSISFPLLVQHLLETKTTTTRSTWKQSSSSTTSTHKYFSSDVPDAMQIKNANKYRKALIAVIHSPKMFHVFQGTGIDILDVYVTKDGKFAKVLFATPFQDRRESLARKLEVNAGKLKSYVSSILKSKNTPRLTFVDAEKRKMEYARETAAFEEIRRERIERGEEEEEGEEGEDGEEGGVIPKDDGRLIRKR